MCILYYTFCNCCKGLLYGRWKNAILCPDAGKKDIEHTSNIEPKLNGYCNCCFIENYLEHKTRDEDT